MHLSTRIDDFGLKQLRPPADEDLHDPSAKCYEQATTIVTSDLDFTKCDQAFPAHRLATLKGTRRLAQRT